MKGKIIIVKQNTIVECDNEKCGYTIPNPNEDLSPATPEQLGKLLNKPCPMCGENLLTNEDCNDFLSFLRTVRRVNRWLGWLSYLFGTNEMDFESGEVKVHKGIYIKRDEKN